MHLSPDKSVSGAASVCRGLTPSSSLTLRCAAALEIAVRQDHAISRDQLAEVGIDRRVVARRQRAGRWRVHGRQTVAVHTGPLGVVARRYRAVWETGADIAQLDGVSALQHAGLEHFNEERTWVSVKHNHNVRPIDGVVIRKVIRRIPDETVTAGVPRSRPDVAAIRGATWAISDRQAALVMVMAVQQRLTTGDSLVRASVRVRRRARRAFIHRVALDIADGAHSLGELDFAAMCRSRGLPEPTRQAVRQGPKGRVYLDAAWEARGWVVEIDGAHHFWGLNPTEDSFRANEVTLGGSRVLRMTLLGLRLDERRFMDQVARALSGRCI